MRDEQLRSELEAAARAFGEVPVPEVGTLRRRARRRRWRQVGAACVLVAAIAGGFVAFARLHASPTYPTGPTGPRPRIGSGAAPTIYRVRLPAEAVGLVSGPGAVYAVLPVTPASGGPPTESRVIRLDTVSRHVTYSQALGAGGSLALAPGAVWFLAGSLEHNGTLDRLDPTTLALQQSIPLRPPVFTVAATAHYLWVGGAAGLFRVDPTSGKVTAVATGWFSSVSVEQTGHVLYAAQATGPGNANMVVTRRDPVTGAVLARSGVLPAVVSGQVLATPNGAWAVIPTGMLAIAEHLRASDLAVDARAGGPGYSAGTNALRGSVGAGVLWLGDQLSGVSCADARTGVLHATHFGPSGAAIAVLNGPELYVAAGSELVVLRPPARCFG